MYVSKKIIVRVFISVLFLSASVKIFAQTTAQEYYRTVNALAEELKSKLEKVQSSVNRSNYEDPTLRLTNYALEDLNNVKKFYLKPNSISMNWDVETTQDRNGEILSVRPYEKPSHREPNYKKQSLVRIMNQDGKGIYIKGCQPYLSPSKYYGTSTISFYDPSGRKIKCRAKLLAFEQLRDLIKSSQLEVVYGRESRPFLDVTGSSVNGGIGATYDRVPDSWLLKSSQTNEVVQLPFGTMWTSTVSNGGYKCITVDVMAARDYEESVLSKSDKALPIYGVELDYSELLQWYKESLDYLMRDLDKLLGVQENKKVVQENAFGEADKREPLGMLMVETSSKIKADKALFEYVIIEESSSYKINVVANNNTIQTAKDFWSKLKHLGATNGNICLYYFGQQGGNTHFNYNVSSSQDENVAHIKKLLDQIAESANNNIDGFLKTIFRCNDKRGYNVESVNAFRIHGVNKDSRYGDKGIDMPCLDLHMSKGDVIYTITINKKDIVSIRDVKDTGYIVKFKK